MKNFFLIVVFTALCFTACDRRDHPGIAELEAGFISPADSMQTSVYWYWISGHISKEGVEKDLESMRQAGINRAFIGNIGLTDNEDEMGPVRLFTEEWWEIVHAALKKATELNIEIGMFNSPGWSQAGGPWIEPGQAMRYLTSREMTVSGPGLYELPVIANPEWQDVKVLAFPDPAAGAAEVSMYDPGVTLRPSIRLDDGFAVEPMQRQAVDYSFAENTPIRSVKVIFGDHGVDGRGEFQALVDGEYKTLTDIELRRVNHSVEVGFNPNAPVVVSLPVVDAKNYRVVVYSGYHRTWVRDIIISEVPYVERYPEKSLAKMFEEPLPMWDHYLWGEQAGAVDGSHAIDREGIMDVTGMVDGGKLNWEMPEGQWRIVRYGMLPTGTMNGPASPEGMGYEVDKLTSRFNRHHFDSFIGAVLDRIPAEDRRTFKVVVADSYEKGGQNFTDTFLEDFEKVYGYDPLPFMPVYDGYVVDNRDISDRFLWDMRRMVADRLSYEHIGGLRKIANEHGLTLWLENYGHWGFPGEFLQYGGQSDEIGGEFWSEGTLGDIENRAASSCGHIYGKRKISAESFTCGGPSYCRYPATMKQRGDLFFSEGINNTLLHVYISQPQDTLAPGMNAWFGNEFSRNNTWYPYMDIFTLYLKRVNFMLQQGLNVADIAYFIGEDAPKMTGLTEPGVPRGFQFDYINAEVILDKMYVEDGMLKLPHGTAYRVLVLPPQETMRPELARKIEKLVKDGGTILGPPPVRSPGLKGYPDADREVAGISANVWPQAGKENIYGKGKVFRDMSLEQVFDRCGILPDCMIDESVPVLFGHRDCGPQQIYFLTNQTDMKIAFTAGFRIEGLNPELWQPVTGEVRALPDYETSGGVTTLPLELDAHESVFVVFTERKPETEPTVKSNFPQMSILAMAANEWTIEFKDKLRGPASPVVTAELFDWTQSDDQRIKYYSGEALYSTTIDIPSIEEGRLYLDVGNMTVMGRVYLNGQYAGGVWTHPYRVDITELVKEGENILEVAMANNWMNRLIGDQNLPEEQRTTFSPYNPWNHDSGLQASGLFGPVVVESVVY